MMGLESFDLYDKQRRMEESLGVYWKEDRWDLNKFPLGQKSSSRPSNRFINFTSQNSDLNNEIKFAIKTLIEEKKWRLSTLKSYQSDIHLLFDWMDDKIVNDSSLIEQPLNKRELSLINWIISKGKKSFKERIRIKYDQNNNKIEKPFKQWHQSIVSLRMFYNVLKGAYDSKSEFEKDVWNLDKLGKSYYIGKKVKSMNFSSLHPIWFKDLIKKYLKLSLSNHEISSLYHKLGHFKTFSAYLKEKQPGIEPKDIDRNLIVDYMAWLSGKSYINSTFSKKISVIKDLLEINSIEKWEDLTDKPIIFNKDYPKKEKNKPRFIPETVMDQLNQKIDDLPEEVMRMTLILQECGMRISELLTISFECLSRDNSRDWFIKTNMRKMKKEHIVPITEECKNIIKEQQSYVMNKFNGKTKHLFPNKYDEPYSQDFFSGNLNRFSAKHNIIDENGILFRFQAHAFRHTVGTRMINNGVPQHIVQRYLGHESPTMTSVYAHIHDQTLKEEFNKFQGKLVDIHGTVIEDDKEVEHGDLQWLKKNIMAQSLPNGYCGLPVVQGGCPHANACLSCQHFRTDHNFLSEHLKQIKETKKIINIAKEKGWTRQVETNEKVLENLQNIVKTIQKKQGGCGGVCGGNCKCGSGGNK